MDSEPKDKHNNIVIPKLKPLEEIRVEPPVPVEPVIKPKVEVKPPEKVVKVETGNTISKDALKKEDEELEKRPEIELLEKLKIHENEERKILAESKQILEELKGAQQMQSGKVERKPDVLKKDLNTSIINEHKYQKIVTPSNEVKNQIENVVKDKLPFPLMIKEAKKINKTLTDANREKRELSSTNPITNNDDEKEENCNKSKQLENEDAIPIENKENYVRNITEEN